MNLKTQLKGTKMNKGESIQDYFTSISQIKEKLSAIGDTLDEDELVMTAPNCLTTFGLIHPNCVCQKRKYDV